MSVFEYALWQGEDRHSCAAEYLLTTLPPFTVLFYSTPCERKYTLKACGIVKAPHIKKPAVPSFYDFSGEHPSRWTSRLSNELGSLNGPLPQPHPEVAGTSCGLWRNRVSPHQGTSTSNKIVGVRRAIRSAVDRIPIVGKFRWRIC